MAPATALLLALLAANDTLLLDCVCRSVRQRTIAARRAPSSGEAAVWNSCCRYLGDYELVEQCEAFEPPSIMVAAVAQLVPEGWSPERPPPASGGEECGGALATIQGLTRAQVTQLETWDLCLVAADCIDSCSVRRMNSVEWNVELLRADGLRQSALSESLLALRRITRAMSARVRCAEHQRWNFLNLHSNKTEFEAEIPAFLQHTSSFWRDFAQLLSLGAEHVSQLLLPLAFQHLDNHTNDQELHEWIKNMKHLRDMLHTKLKGWIIDMQLVSEQVANYKVQEDANSPGKYLIRRPLLSDRFLDYHEAFLSLGEDFGAPCQRRQPRASQMLGLADALYSFYRYKWIDDARHFNRYNSSDVIYFIDDEGELEDSSNATVPVDTECVQLLVDALDRPTCPLEDLSPETVTRRDQCRVQLWHDMVQQSPCTRMTSHVAHAQRTNVSLCLLAWMAVNSFAICQDVPFSMLQSVRDARCYFYSPDDQSCPELNATEAFCSVSRAILLLSCHDFSFHKHSNLCGVYYYTDGSHSKKFGLSWENYYKGYVKPNRRILNYKDTLNSTTLKYKDLKNHSLKPTENILVKLLLLCVISILAL